MGPAWSRWVNAVLPRDAVSYPRMRLLRTLECHGNLTMTELANSLGVTQRRVTALVDALVEDGFVERTPHPTDGRSTVISLTKAGRAQEQRNWQQHQTEIARAFGDLSAAHQKQLLEITPILTEALRKRAAEHPAEDDAFP
jgi:DNA-binding MarR family transcriptional regulator